MSTVSGVLLGGRLLSLRLLLSVFPLLCCGCEGGVAVILPAHMSACMAKCTTLCSVYQPASSTKILNSRSLTLHTRGIRASDTTLVILHTHKKQQRQKRARVSACMTQLALVALPAAAVPCVRERVRERERRLTGT